MTDKTSTAPVMSLQQVRDEMKMMFVQESMRIYVHERWPDAIDAHLNAPTPDVVGGDVVAWQFRIERDDGTWSKWEFWKQADRPDVFGLDGRKAEYRPLVLGNAAQPKGDLLDAPALVGNTIFDRGTKCSNVIARAQLAYKHKDDVMPPEQITEMRAAVDRARGTQAPIAASHPAEQTRGNGCPCEPSGSDGLSCPGKDGRLLCDPKHKPEQTRGDGVVEAMISAAISLIRDAEEYETADGLMNAAQLHLWHALEDAIEKVGPADISNSAPRQAVPEFTRTKPLVPGYYLVRGYTWPYEGEAYDKQAAVEVRQRDDGLVVNLHEKNSDEDMDRWYLVETIDSNFEWAMLAAAPSAGRMGVDRG